MTFFPFSLVSLWLALSSGLLDSHFYFVSFFKMSKLSWVSFCLGLLEFCCGSPAVYFGKLFITAHRKWSFHANDMQLTV